MREILFRGKSIDNGKWIYGGYFHLHKTTYCYAGCDDGDNDIHRIVFERMTDWNVPNRHMMADVDPETVGQYTGLTDKNGRKIFEGDICRFNRFNTVYVGRIVFDINPASFVMWYHSIVGAYGETATHKMLIYECVEIEVIGNIHDNPELLEGGAEK